MKAFEPRFLLALALSMGLTLSIACNENNQRIQQDYPRVSPKVSLRDLSFYSKALNKDMQYRVILPSDLASGRRLPVVYLLHGGGGGFRDWSNYSDVAQFAERGLILIMPEGDSSYYTNSAERAQDRYEDYIVGDLIADVENKLPTAPARNNRAVAGVSMGGFGAIKLALRHPHLFTFAGGISPALDVPSRPFSIKRFSQWQFHKSIFGPPGSNTRRDNDPFVLARRVDPASTPFLYLVCGDQEGLLPVNRSFADLLQGRQFQYAFHEVKGGHDWAQWSKSTLPMFERLLKHLRQQDDAQRKSFQKSFP